MGKDWERFEVRREIGSPPHRLVLRGFGVPDHRGGTHSRLVVLIEPGARPKEGIPPQAAERYRFTPREEAVIKSLSQGWTNKEIAAALGISLPTVKEHIRHIMEKTKARTRTGVLVRVFKPDDASAASTSPSPSPPYAS
jgi:DNA-binding CsgD family transcriptional regulator